jgi:hypothetical protein
MTAPLRPGKAAWALLVARTTSVMTMTMSAATIRYT